MFGGRVVCIAAGREGGRERERERGREREREGERRRGRESEKGIFLPTGSHQHAGGKGLRFILEQSDKEYRSKRLSQEKLIQFKMMKYFLSVL